MDAPQDAAQAHAEAVKVETWCRVQKRWVRLEGQ